VLKGATFGADWCLVQRSSFRLGSVVVVAALAVTLLVGCGGGTSPADGSRLGSSAAVSPQRATAYAQAVNLKPGDVAGFASSGAESRAPAPGPLQREYFRCLGEVPASPVAMLISSELTSGRARRFELLQSNVAVWPTAQLVVSHVARSHRPRGEACLRRFIEAKIDRSNRERGFRQRGRFTLKTVPIRQPGVTDSSFTEIDETVLRRNGAVLTHVYRDQLGFASGQAEVELEAVGFGHPVPAELEARALHLLVSRALAAGGSLRS
jgi:hypothetical protein